MSDRAVHTKAGLLELHEELHIVSEGYEFLDEKRFLLASQIRTLMKEYAEMNSDITSMFEQIKQNYVDLEAAFGLEYLQLKNIRLNQCTAKIDKSNFLGVKLPHLTLTVRPEDRPIQAASVKSFSSSMYEFTKLLIRQSDLARELRLLVDDYTLTQRRARALENIIIPEIKRDINKVNDSLLELDMEEAVRVRLFR